MESMVKKQMQQYASRCFSAPTIREISNSRLPENFRLLAPILAAKGDNPIVQPKVRDAFSAAMQILDSEYRTEYFYKATLVEKFVAGKYSPSTTSVYNEYRVGETRADLVLVNNKAEIFEIKTSLDDMTKSIRQAYEYYSCFDLVYFVVDKKHIESCIEFLPESTGILSISEKKTIKKIREAESMRDLLDPMKIFYCLHRKEYESYIDKVDPINSKRMSYEDVCNFFKDEDPRSLHEFLVLSLRKRNRERNVISRLPRLPKFLWAAAYMHDIKGKEWDNLINILDKDMEEVV